MPDPRFEAGEAFSSSEVAAIETAIGFALPPAYRAFVEEYGGAFVGGLVDGSTDLPILTFFGANDLLSRLTLHPDLKDDQVLPFADCELGNLYVMRQDGDVHYLNYYGGTTSARQVAPSFDNFLGRIVVDEDE